MSYTAVNIVIPMILFVVCYYKRKSKRYRMLPLLYIALISMFGYDSVSDYAQYVTYFAEVRHGHYYQREDVSLGYWLINRLFTFSEYGYTLVMGLSVGLFYYSCYRVLKRFDCVLLGTFLLYVLWNCIIQHENIIRQNYALAIGNFLFLYLYGKKLSSRRIVVSLLCLALAYAFHYTVVLGVLLFAAIHFGSRLRIRINVWAILIFLGLWVAIYFYGLFDQLANMLDMFGYYGEKTTSILENTYKYREHGLSLRVSLSTFLLLFMFYFYNSKEHIYIVKFATIVILLSFLTIQISLIHRIYLYYEMIEVVGVCLVVKHLRSSRQMRLLSMCVVMYFALTTYLEVCQLRRYYGDYTYKTIFSEDCKNGMVYIRQVGKTHDLKDVSDREGKTKAY